ncbi:SCP2 sterol-binding domain-containing protein [Nocardioides sp. TRM66260-LWL]|uniref:SCP2 sterol-binding domain-containing protein n=1 Tax=Nocardioides sp. TRM66260-LWL TaxID=2874478 RepID=UPI001CC6FE09|nr:SCP2 sterol-binding domain-containing protein [Nocardioides sp. TRM66260-LWL]MBZ5735317.1 SCP2 sterol-binding domain-containing protein [Nocardioides sp. TRM66260-LWL]
MTVKLGTVEFYEAMADALNNDPVWAEKGKKIDFDMAYKYEAPQEGQFFVSFEQGKVVEVRDATQADLDGADFLISGSSDVWRGCFDGSINPTVAMTRGQLRVRGKMAQMLKNMPAFMYIQETMGKVDFE